MSRLILNKQRLITPSPVSITRWTRPNDWLDMPELIQGDEKIYLLIKVSELGKNFHIFKVTEDYTVDWGDGTANTNHSSGTDAEHEFLWENVPSSSLTSDGFRQVIVTITPQSGSQLKFYGRPSSPYHATGDSHRGGGSNVISVKMAGVNFTSLYLGFYQYSALREFEFVGTNSITNLNNCFSSCSNLRKVYQFDTSTVTSFSNLFSGCVNLINVPPFDTTSGTVFTGMYTTCSSIKYIPPFSVVGATSLTQTFHACVNLSNNPISDFTGITSLSQTYSQTNLKILEMDLPNLQTVHVPFDGMSNLEIIRLNIPTGVLQNMSYMFRGCKQLKEIKPFDTSNVTNFRYAFNGVFNIKDFGWIDTSNGQNFEGMFNNTSVEDLSFLNITSNATNVKNLFYGCKQLKKVPSTIDCTNLTSLQGLFAYCYSLVEFPNLLNTGGITSTYNTFLGCGSLTVAPDITGTLTSCRGMFSGANSLEKIPNYDLSNVVAWPNGYQFCSSAHNLRESLVTQIKSRHSYSTCALSRDKIVDIFNNLGTAAGSQKTIYVNKNPGSSELTAADLLIATDKGWTVVS